MKEKTIEKLAGPVKRLAYALSVKDILCNIAIIISEIS